ncbi:uncharacterized protein KQ657_001328 [Scheffersomyces spartinae]|uniref:DNA replication checkpoint mediator MRC1 domain-containing protein n=1 Tax=Scheffersomyces spartinae TaxID=45513 RepID=A0A9P7V7W6_9ASCO|nr:uncharacterized protein KQ657_001328 [Scheffersomyces spartinae]KAG7192871.1 hypothetical protein KQ657_001328 [Scheffersomyces spartinae]
MSNRLANQSNPSTPRTYDNDSGSDDDSHTQTQVGVLYGKTQPIPVDSRTQDAEVEEEDIQPSQIDFGQSMLFNNLVTQATVVPDLHQQEEDQLMKATQRIGEPESSNDGLGLEFDFNASSLFSNIISQAQKVPSFDDKTQIESGNESTQTHIELDRENTQTQIVLDRENTQTQIESDIQTQVLNDSDKENVHTQIEPDENAPFQTPEHKLTASERLARITQLANEKRQVRLQKEREAEAKQLEADITKTSLTDEENDLLEDLRSSDRLSSDRLEDSQRGKYGRDVKRVQELINIAKRDQVIVPQFVRRKEFSKKDLIRAFESEDEQHEVDPLSSPLGLSTSTQQKSPLTSPIKTHTSQSMHLNKPIESYAMGLRDNGMIELDGEEDDDQEEGAIPELSKEQQLSIKQRFIRRKQKSNTMVNLPKQMRSNMMMMASTGKNNHKGHSELLHSLTKENIQQLVSVKNQNPDQQILQEMQKDDEIMDSLLEREIERVNRIRLKEKLKAKAAQALLKKEVGEGEDEGEGEGEVGDVPDSEVPDSDFSEEGESDENDGDEGDSESDAKVEVEADADGPRDDDSYMFGVKKTDARINQDEMLVTSNNTPLVTEDYDDDDNGEDPSLVNFSIVSEGDLFKNLTGTVQDADVSFTRPDDDHHDLNLLQVVRPQPGADDTTQVDGTQVATQVDTKMTQVIGSMADDGDDDDDDISPSKVAAGRRHVRRRMAVVEEDEDEDEAEAEGEAEVEAAEEVDHEAAAQLQKQYEDRLRRQELKSRKKRKDLERRGLRKLVDGEALESEDEWQGLGGAEGDFSDDQGNSEDEKMIDNSLLVDLNDEAVKKKFMQQYQISDTKELEKLLDDIKNHRLSKRGVGNGFDIELSDEEDELLMKYRQQKMKQQNEKLMANKKIRQLAQQEKSKAFFMSMQEGTSSVRIEEDEEDEEDGNEGGEGGDDVGGEGGDNEVDEDLETSLDKQPPKKLLKIEESFVVKQLSFLSASREDEYERMQRLSRLQHGFDSSEDEVEDIQTLKSKCLARLSTRTTSETSSKRSFEEVETDADDDADDDFNDVITSFKKPSIIKSFKSFQQMQGVQIKDGKQSFSGVTVNKHYKVATGSKASITYISNNKKQVSNKEEHIKKSIRLNRTPGSRIFTDSGFD